MVSKELKIVNSTGLHARPASDFVAKAKEFTSAVTIQNLDKEGGVPVNAKSILRVLSEGMRQDANVRIAADGADEQAALDALSQLIESGFGE